MMLGHRLAFLVIGMAATSCSPDLSPDMSGAAPSPRSAGNPTVSTGELDVRLSRGLRGPERRPALLVRIANISESSVCLPTDMIEDPYSQSVVIELRADGKPIPYGSPGFVEGPRPGESTLRPGGFVMPYYYFDNWFEMPEGGLKPGTRYQARIRFAYSICGRQEKLSSAGDWQDI